MATSTRSRASTSPSSNIPAPRAAARARAWFTASSGGWPPPPRSISGLRAWPSEGVESERDGERLRFRDPEGLEHELGVHDVPDEPLIAEHPEVPAEHALQGFHGVRAYASDPARSRDLLEAGMGFRPEGDGWEARAESRGGTYAYDAPPAERGLQGAGTVHHIAWATTDEEHPAWIEQVRSHGARPTDVIDRHYFRSIYYREPSGVLFELATPSPGFTIDEPLETLGEKLSIPPFLESRRADIEAAVKPLPYKRAVSSGS